MYANCPVPGSSWPGRSAAVPVRVFIISNQIQYKWSVPLPWRYPPPSLRSIHLPVQSLFVNPIFSNILLPADLVLSWSQSRLAKAIQQRTYGYLGGTLLQLYGSTIYLIYTQYCGLKHINNSDTTRTQRRQVLMCPITTSTHSSTLFTTQWVPSETSRTGQPPSMPRAGRQF